MPDSHAGQPPPPPKKNKKNQRPTWKTHDWSVVPSYANYALVGFPLPPLFSLLCSWSSVGGGGPLFPCLVVVDWNDVKVHLAMAPVAVMLNLRADALTAACSGDYQCGRPTTGIKAAHCLTPTCATAVQLAQPALPTYPKNGTRCAAEGRQPSKPTWVSVQDVVLNSLRPSTQPSQPLPELSHFYTQATETRDVCSCRYGSCWCVTP